MTYGAGHTSLIAGSDRACFVVHNQDGQELAYVYYEDEPGARSTRWR